MPSEPYYATQWTYQGWVVGKRTKTGNRIIAWRMSEKYARRVARLLNAEGKP